ncbi:MAG: hypothetical protein K6E29_03070 [Cyanobacteria bacterium RUI128]|nr:hypothetical protein [Cyanobacteria bacterium RUI128]
MKKLLLSAIFCVLAASFVYAEDIQQTEEPANKSIDLELAQPQKTYNLQRQNYTKNVSADKTVTNSPEVQDYSKTNPNQKRTANFGKKKKLKDVSVGTQSSHTTTSDTYSGSSTVYTEYEKKNFKLNSGYTRNTTPTQENADKGSVSVTPEYKINKHVSVQNKYSTDLNTDSKKGEVKLNVQPFKDDRMDLGVGVGQKYSNTSQSSSQVNFSTNIRF